MRKILFLTVIAFISVGTLFAQNSVLRDARRSLGRNDLNEAKNLIQQASQNPETAINPETWKIMGDIGNKSFDNERTKAMLGQSTNDKVMYDGLMESYVSYLKSDSLAELPDDRGRVRNSVRKDIASILQANHPFYINGGVYYNDLNDYSKAADFFEVYWTIPTLPLYDNPASAFLLDSTYQTIKYYAIITAIQAEEHNRALDMIKRAMSEPFIENSSYQESDLYELMASEYIMLGDSAMYLETLYLGSEKFPSSRYFIPNLVNVFIREGDSDKAMQYLDQAIANDPSNSCDLNSVKGALLAEQGDFESAELEYNKALAQDPNCERALEALAVNYILQAQDLREISAQLTDRQQQVANDEKAIQLYEGALIPLEKYSELLRSRGSNESEIQSALLKLRNVYYNLSNMGVDKSAEMEAIEKELNLN